MSASFAILELQLKVVERSYKSLLLTLIYSYSCYVIAGNGS